MTFDLYTCKVYHSGSSFFPTYCKKPPVENAIVTHQVGDQMVVHEEAQDEESVATCEPVTKLTDNFMLNIEKNGPAMFCISTCQSSSPGTYRTKKIAESLEETPR